MTTVAVGVPVQPEPELLVTTLGALHRQAEHPREIVLVNDGRGTELSAPLHMEDVRQSARADSTGSPAAFSRLAETIQSDIVILPEPGSTPEVDALEGLVNALLADPRNGIAGPSVLLDPDEAILAAYVTLRLSVEAGREPALIEATAPANYGLLSGSFEVDVDTSEVRYRASLPLDVGEIAPAQVAALLSDVLEMTSEYAPSFKAVVEAGAEPRAAIEAVEASEPEA